MTAFDLWLANEPGQMEPDPDEILEQARVQGYPGDDIDEAKDFLCGQTEDRDYDNRRG